MSSKLWWITTWPKKKQRSEVSTGLFSCIHKSKKCVDKPANSFGLDLVCEGVGIGSEKNERQEKGGQ